MGDDLTGRLWRCRRCGHAWRGRLPTRPVCCPACKSTGWAAPEKKEEATT